MPAATVTSLHQQNSSEQEFNVPYRINQMSVVLHNPPTPPTGQIIQPGVRYAHRPI